MRKKLLLSVALGLLTSPVYAQTYSLSTPLAPSAITDTTNATNISNGILAAGRLPTPTASTLGGIQSTTGASHQWISSITTSGVPTLTQPASGDISGLGTAATVNTGTSGSVIPLLSGVNTWSGAQTFSAAVTMNGTVSGTGVTSLLSSYAPLASPAFTGTPTAPTALGTDNSTTIATTAWVTSKIASVTSGVSTVLGNSGAVTLTQLVSGGVAPLASPIFTGTPTAPTATAGDNSTTLATTAFAATAVSNALATMVPARTSGAVAVLYGAPAGTNAAGTLTGITLGTNLAISAGVLNDTYSYTLPAATSSTLGGVEPDGTTITNTSGAISVTYGTTAGTAAQGNDARITGALSSATAASTYAPLASPALTGTPTAPTASPGTSTTQLATTAFVGTANTNAIAAALPAATGKLVGATASAGTTTAIAIGTNLAISAGTLNNTYTYSLPTATSSTLGGVKPDGTTITNSSGAISVTYGTAAGTAAQGNDSRITGALSVIAANATYATIANPTFTGTVTTPALTVSGNTTQTGTLFANGVIINGTGVRVTLASTYTVPANTSLVRFINTGTLAASTITMPTAIGDGQEIQFVNYGGTVTSTTFSPTINGWTNASTFAPYSSIRVRWDATASAWYREQ